MAQRGVPGGWDSPADRPSILAITVESAPRRRATVRPAHVLIALALFGAIAAVVVIAVLPGGGPGSAAPPAPAHPAPAPPQPSVLVDSGPPGPTAPGLYRIPLGCRGSGTTPQSTPCSLRSGYVVAVLRRVGTRWRGTLESIDPSCVHMPMPPLARGKVRACGH